MSKELCPFLPAYLSTDRRADTSTTHLKRRKYCVSTSQNTSRDPPNIGKATTLVNSLGVHVPSLVGIATKLWKRSLTDTH